MKLKSILGYALFFTVIFSASAYAASAPSPTPKPAPTKIYGGESTSYGGNYDTNARSYSYGTCTVPNQTNATAYDRNATFASSTVPYTFLVDIHRSYTVSRSWSMSDGSGSGTETVRSGTDVVSTGVTRYGTDSCGVSVTQTGGSRESGEVRWKAVASHGQGRSSDATGVDYWVTKVDMKVGNGGEGDNDSDGEYFYEDEAPKVPTCTKWYGTSKSMNPSNCTITPNGYATGSVYNTQCYYYNDPYTSAADKSCTRSYHVQSVAITAGPTKVYTGIRGDYTCNATFYSWTTPKVVNVSGLNKSWYSVKTSGAVASGTNYNFIGDQVSASDSHNARYFYTDPHGRTYNLSNSYRSIATNSFFSADPQDGNYNIFCHYIPKDYTARFFANTSNSTQSVDLTKQKTSKSVTNYGIKELRLSVNGCFNTGNTANYTCTNSMSGNISGYLLPSQTSHFNGLNKEWSQFDFLTGNWYNFKAEMMYTDNSNGTGGGAGLWRDITDAPESFWAYYPNYASNNTYNTLMPKDGRDHRISGNGMNTVRASFYNNVQTIGSFNRITTSANDFWAHQVNKIIIRGSGGNYTTYPKVGTLNATQNPQVEVDKTKVNLNDTVNYTAWVIWSDQTTNPYGRGKVENWTNDLIWYGDDMIGKGSYKFVRRGNEDYRSVKVSYADPDGDKYSASSKIFKNEWDYAYDNLSVYVQETCAPPYLAISQCQSPKNNDLTFGFAQGSNLVTKSPWYRQGYGTLLPPSLAQKYGFSNWDEPNYPYNLDFTFDVTGTSNGVAEK